MISYILEVSICWAGFYGLYVLLLSKTTFFNANRIYLLGAVLLGLIVPLLEMPAPASGAERVVHYLQPLSLGVEQIEVTVTAGAGKNGFDFYTFLIWSYWIGVVLTGSRLLYGLWQIRRLYQRGKKEQRQGYLLIRTPDAHLPFSFFGTLYWSDRLEVEDEDFRTILQHEKAHISGGHSFDVMLIEFLCVFLWCSPVLYLYRRSLRNIHEYLADNAVLQTTRRKKYGHLLLRQSQSGLQIALANHFIQSQLKKRITMMTRHQTSKNALMRYLLAIPLLVLFLLAFANRELIGQTLLEIHRPDGTIEQHELTNPKLADNFFSAEHVESVEILKPADKTMDMIIVKLKNDQDTIPIKEKADTKLELKTAPGIQGPIEVEIYHPDGTIEKQQIDTPDQLDDIDPEKIARINVRKKPGDEGAGLIQVYLKGAELPKDNQEKLAERITQEVKNGLKTVEEMPRFPGCEDLTDPAERQRCSSLKLVEFIGQNIKYPEAAKEAGLEGNVVLELTIDAGGNIQETKIVKDIGGGAGEEAQRVAGSMPKWVPGVKDGKATTAKVTLPIRFKMNENDLAVPKSQLELKDFSVAPNPTAGQFQLRFRAAAGTTTIRVTDLSGRELFRRQLNDFDGYFDQQIDLSNEAKGPVLLIVRQGDQIFSQQIILQ